MKSQKPFFLDSPLGVTCLLGLLLFAVSAFNSAIHVGLDYFDSYNFLVQARRFTQDGMDTFYSYDRSRPRTLVMLFVAFDFITQVLTSHLPSLTATHVLMVVISLSYFLVWIGITSTLFDRAVGYVVGLFLMSSALLTHYSFVAHTDILSGFLLGALFLAVLKTNNAVLLGVLGALLGLSKHHFLMVWPLLVLLLTYRKLSKWTWVSLFVFVVTVDLSTRVFGHWGEGIGPHFRHIVRQARASVSETTSPTLYLRALYQLYGPLFWGLALLSMGIAAKKLVGTLKSQKRTMLCMAIAFLAFLALLQITPHREIRYLIPFLPGLLIPVALGAIRSYAFLPRMLKPAWLGLWLISLYPALGQSYADFTKYKEDRIYDSKQAGLSDLWTYTQSLKCKEISTCLFEVSASKPWEFPDDVYYRRYDFGPNYGYYLGILAAWQSCPNVTGENERAIWQSLHTARPQADCFLMTEITETHKRVRILSARKCDELSRYPECYESRDFLIFEK